MRSCCLCQLDECLGWGRSRKKNLRSWKSGQLETCETWTYRCSNSNSAGLVCACMNLPAVSTPAKLYRTGPPNPFPPIAETEPMIRRLAEKVWAASRKESRIARTVVLKFKTSEFKILTRSHTPASPPSCCEELTSIALSLRERVGLSPHQRFRLVGGGLSNFCDPEDASAQPALFS